VRNADFGGVGTQKAHKKQAPTLADQPETLIEEIDTVLRELGELPSDRYGGRPWDGFPPSQHMNEQDRLRERWQWRFRVLMDKLNWFFRNSTEYRQLEMATLRSRIDWAMFGTASVTRDLLRGKELLQMDIPESGTAQDNTESNQGVGIPINAEERTEWFIAHWDRGRLLKRARQALGHNIKKAREACKNDEDKAAPENTYKGWESRHRFPRVDYRPSVFSYIAEGLRTEGLARRSLRKIVGVSLSDIR